MSAFTRRACPICSSTRSTALVRRVGIPTLQNALYRTSNEARKAMRGELDMLSCDDCRFVWNSEFDSGRIAYTTSYENCQSLSGEFRSHLDARIDRIAQALPTNRKATVVEVGAGQGDFIARLTDRLGGERFAAVYGFDPAWRGEDGTGPNGARLYRQLFDRDVASRLQIEPDIVISRHTIEHIPEPLPFLKAIRATSAPSRRTKLFVETPCNYWIQGHSAFQDFFYEHCSIFDVNSIAAALSRSGFVPTRIERVFGDQYLWAEAEADIGLSARFGSYETALRDDWRSRLEALRQHGEIVVWGAGAKGACFLLLLDPDAALVDAVVDVNERKQGGFLPGTGHRIVSPQAGAESGAGTIVVMNPNYLGEIETLAHSLGWYPRFIAIDQ